MTILYEDANDAMHASVRSGEPVEVTFSTLRKLAEQLRAEVIYMHKTFDVHDSIANSQALMAAAEKILGPAYEAPSLDAKPRKRMATRIAEAAGIVTSNPPEAPAAPTLRDIVAEATEPSTADIRAAAESLRIRLDAREQRESEAAPFEAIKEALRAGVQVVAVPQLFPTPPDVAGRMVALAGIEIGNRVLEPSAGAGMPRQVAALQPIATSWQELPPDTFAGTSVRAVLLTIAGASFAVGAGQPSIPVESKEHA